MRILVDTNVFLDFLLDRGADTIIAKEFFRNCLINRMQTFLTSMSLRDIGYAAHKFFHSEKKAREIQINAYSLCSKVISITNDDAITSLYSDMKDYEDSLIVESAKREMIDLIITNNVKDFEKTNFPIWTPKEFNDVINRNQNN